MQAFYEQTNWHYDRWGHAMTGKQNGFVTLLAKSVPHETIALFTKKTCVPRPLKNCIRWKKLYQLSTSSGPEVSITGSLNPFWSKWAQITMLWFTSAKFAGLASTLFRFWSLRHEIKTFMTNKGKDVLPG